MIRSASLSRFRSSPEAGVFSGNEGIGSPLGLGNTAAWYDVSDLSSMRNDAGAIPSTGEGIKLWADKSGNSSTNVLCLNGVAGNYASAPNNAAYNITDLDLRVYLSLPSWTAGAADASIFARYQTAGQRVFWMQVLADGRLRLFVSLDGTAVLTGTSSTPVPFTAFQTGWVRVTRVASTGVYTFYTGGPGTTPTWVALGTTVTLGTGSPFNGTSIVEVGSANVGVSTSLCNIYRAQFLNGVDGATVFDANFSLPAKLAPSFTESSSNAATVTINTSGATGARISGARDLYQGTAANQPIYLPHSGTNYGYLNGVSGNVFTSPDSAAMPTGDAEFIFRAKFADWTPAANNYFGSKYDGGTQNTFYFALLTSGALRMGIDPTGSALVAIDSNAATGITDGDTAWIRVTVDVDNGAGGCNVAFYKATDQSTEPSSWTQIGTTVTSAGTKSFFNSTTQFVFGGLTTSSGLMSGNLLRGIIKNGIGGSTVVDFNPALYTSGTTFTASTGEVWTINGGATIVTSTCLYLDGVNDYLKAAAFALSQPETVYFVGSQVTWTSGDYLMGGNINTWGVSQHTSTPRLSLEAGAFITDNSDLAVATNGIATAVTNGASSSIRINRGTATTGNASTGAMNGFTLGAVGGGTAWANITAQEVAIFSTAHNTAQQDAIILYEGRKWGVAV